MLYLRFSTFKYIRTFNSLHSAGMGLWCGVVWCGVVVVWCGVMWCGVVWCGGGGQALD